MLDNFIGRTIVTVELIVSGQTSEKKAVNIIRLTLDDGTTVLADLYSVAWSSPKSTANV